MAERARGTLLQMSRMISKNSAVGLVKGISPWDDESSDGSSDEEVSTTIPALSQPLHSLSSAVEVLQKSIENQASQAKRPRFSEATAFSEFDRSGAGGSYLPRPPQGMDSNLFREVYNLGVEAGLARRIPEEPCKVCKTRREKNRIAAAEQRKRARENLSEEN
jgi:hypothetical protein